MSRIRTIALALMCLAAPGAAFAQSNQITIGTQPVGTAFNAVGTAMAQVFVEELGVRATAQPYAGNTVYSPLVNNGELTLALTTTYALGLDAAGTANAPAMSNLRAVARVWRLPYGYMVRKDSGLASIADLKGKRVVVDIRGAASLKETNEFMLAAGGVDVFEVMVVDVASLPQGVQAVVDGTVDATTIAVPTAAVQEANATVSGGVRFLDIAGPNATQAFLSERAPGLTLLEIKGGSMAGVSEDVTLLALETVLYTSAQLSDEEVGRILGALHKRWAGLQGQFPFLNSVQTAGFVDAASMAIPYHQGAVAYFKAAGTWTDEAEARQQELMSKLK